MQTALHKKLYEQAQVAMDRAYSPYSQYNVGVALQTVDGKMFIGCNVENVSYGLTLCGERNAITSMVATCGDIKIADIMIVVSGEGFPSPCGACRQVLAEFSIPETQIHLARTKENGDGFEMRTYRMAALLPLSFTQQILWAPNTDPKKYDSEKQASDVVHDSYTEKLPEHEVAYAEKPVKGKQAK